MEEALAWQARWCLPVALLGSAAAVGLVRSKCTFLEMVAPAERWLSEAATLALAALAAAALLVVGTWQSGVQGMELALRLVPGVAFQALHLAGFGSILCNLRLPPATSVLAQVVTVWSAGLFSAEAGARAWTALLDVASHPMRCAFLDERPTAALSSAAAVAALLLVSWLVRRPTAGPLTTPAP